MWKTVLVLAILALIYPVVESQKKKSDSTRCRRTNSEAFRYCMKPCSSDKDCKSNQKCLCDGDCGMSCVRNNLRCKDPPRGRSLNIKLTNGRYFGSMATHSCNSPYKLRGSAIRTCRAIGKWDGKKAKCRIICKDPGDIAYGNRRYDGFQAGKTIQYWCYNAYILEGSHSITCLKSGQWSAPKPVCRLPNCTPPTIPDSASVIYPRNMPKIFRYSDRVELKCKPGYVKTGNGVLECKGNNTWSGSITCSRMCKDPGDIAYGNRRFDGFQAGKTIQYWCYDSYTLEGSPRITCLKSGQWSAPKPVCRLPSCTPPTIPDSASVIYPRKMPKIFRYSDRVALKCKPGYFKSGLGVLECKGNNTWRGRITCSPKSCGRPGKVLHGKILGYVYSFKQKIQYVCDQGYTLKGPAYRICQANEEWSGAQPICEAVNCGPLKKPDHGDIIEQVGFTFGKRIVFRCNRGYEMKGSRERRCQNDGTWSGSATTCELIQCGDPGTPANGQQIVNKGYFYGGSVKFVCNKDYTLQGTSKPIYCQADKTWSASVPRCLASCPDPGVPYQGHRFGQDFRHGSTVTFTCPKDYIMDGVSTISCSNGKWSNTKPSCYGFPFHWTLNGTDKLLGLHGTAKYVQQHGRKVLYLDGNRGTYAETPAIPIHSTDLTISVWIKLKYSGTQTIYGDWSLPHSFRFWIERDGSLCGQFRDDSNPRKDIIGHCTARRVVVPTNHWKHVAITWSRAARVVRLFVNGEMKLAGTVARYLNINFKNSGHAVYDIGLKRDNGITAHAYFSDLMVYSREFQFSHLNNVNEIKNRLFLNHPLHKDI